MHKCKRTLKEKWYPFGEKNKKQKYFRNLDYGCNTMETNQQNETDIVIQLYSILQFGNLILVKSQNYCDLRRLVRLIS